MGERIGGVTMQYLIKNIAALIGGISCGLLTHVIGGYGGIIILVLLAILILKTE